MNNILIVDNSSHVTGANKSIAGFARQLANKYNFYWAVTPYISERELKDVIGQQPYERVEFTEISKKLSTLTQYLPRLYKNTRELEKIIKKNGISIVHMNDCYNMCGVLLKIVNKNVQVVYHVRLLRTSYISRLYGLFVAAIKWKADAIICCSDAVCRDVGPSRVAKHIIYDSESFSDAPNDEPAVREEVKKIIYVGNVLPGKGHAYAIKALELLRVDYPDIRLHFVGKFDHNEVSSKFKKKLDSLIKEASLEPQISFDGFTLDIEKEIRTADILLNLSESESFSMVCLEALKAGVPLVVADSGGPSELFEHTRSGWLVPNRDYVAASEAIRTLVGDYSMRKQFAAEGKKYASQKFNIVENAAKLDSLYSKLGE